MYKTMRSVRSNLFRLSRNDTFFFPQKSDFIVLRSNLKELGNYYRYLKALVFLVLIIGFEKGNTA